MSNWFNKLSTRNANKHRYTEVTRKSYGSRLGNSVGATFFGFLLFIGSFLVLWFNEGRAVKTAKGLDEGLAQVEEINIAEVNNKNENKLIYAYGTTSCEEILSDQEFGIEVNALKLVRTVEMFQWKENSTSKTDKKIGGAEETTTDYTYEQVWSEELIKSSDFKLSENHQNPSTIGYASYSTSASEAYLGKFLLPNSMIEQMINFKGLSLGNLDKSKYTNAKIITENDNSLADGKSIQKLFFGYGTSMSPEIGDYKISYKYISIGDYSIIAKQIGNTFSAFETTTGSSIQMVETGKVSVEKMFELAQSRNSVLTWVLRFAGIFMMFFGINMMFGILSTLVSVLPILSSIVNFGVGVFAGVLSFALSLITIALAWIFYRPILGAIILVVAVSVILFFYKKSLNKKRG